jgi:apolipoprotein N-acyltransferase
MTNRKIGAKLLVNITNDSWFGKKTGPKQHFTHVKFRAIEEGLPLIRSSNMGFSGLINPLGEIVDQVETKSNSYIDVKIPNEINTFYSLYRYDIIYFLIALITIIGYFTKLLFKKYKI